MDVWLRAVVIILCTIVGSTGLWSYLQSRNTKHSATTRLMMGIAYDKLISQGLTYLERGSITQDEFADYSKYLYDPYRALGGNGVAERMMRQVETLPYRPRTEHPELFVDRERFISNVSVVNATGKEAASK